MSVNEGSSELRLAVNAGGDDQIVVDLRLPGEALVEDVLSELERVSVEEELPIWRRSSLLAVASTLLEQRTQKPDLEREMGGEFSVESVRAAAARFCQAYSSSRADSLQGPSAAQECSPTSKQNEAGAADVLRLFRELMGRKEDRDAVLHAMRDFGNVGLKLSERRVKAQQEAEREREKGVQQILLAAPFMSEDDVQAKIAARNKAHQQAIKQSNVDWRREVAALQAQQRVQLAAFLQGRLQGRGFGDADEGGEEEGEGEEVPLWEAALRASESCHGAIKEHLLAVVLPLVVGARNNHPWSLSSSALVHACCATAELLFPDLPAQITQVRDRIGRERALVPGDWFMTRHSNLGSGQPPFLLAPRPFVPAVVRCMAPVLTFMAAVHAVFHLAIEAPGRAEEASDVDADVIQGLSEIVKAADKHEVCSLVLPATMECETSRRKGGGAGTAGAAGVEEGGAAAREEARRMKRMVSVVKSVYQCLGREGQLAALQLVVPRDCHVPGMKAAEHVLRSTCRAHDP